MSTVYEYCVQPTNQPGLPRLPFSLLPCWQGRGATQIAQPGSQACQAPSPLPLRALPPLLSAASSPALLRLGQVRQVDNVTGETSSDTERHGIQVQTGQMLVSPAVKQRGFTAVDWKRRKEKKARLRRATN